MSRLSLNAVRGYTSLSKKGGNITFNVPATLQIAFFKVLFFTNLLSALYYILNLPHLMMKKC